MNQPADLPTAEPVRLDYSPAERSSRMPAGVFVGVLGAWAVASIGAGAITYACCVENSVRGDPAAAASFGVACLMFGAGAALALLLRFHRR
ncbi:MAG: hypothetical protein QM770_17145 [Tepidisphaeraceae bacterium]